MGPPREDPDHETSRGTFEKYFGDPLVLQEELDARRRGGAVPPLFLRRSLSYVRQHVSADRRRCRAELRRLVAVEIGSSLYTLREFSYVGHSG
eukprot:CAMPEP_0194319786 /NCGR_PEP_ID=MMETSP0171-20130528/16205_1 /TAXON_ID=218684 /ORGANISM="Corethron pennatum, Strain L29A3" /LENGTH=92 /DNA_ID=CAMNT_0039077135 /DNA_START=211 /DNA_END=485 /DNA_ORIENTATION=-